MLKIRRKILCARLLLLLQWPERGMLLCAPLLSCVNLQATLISSATVVEVWPVGAFNIINGADAFTAGAQGFR